MLELLKTAARKPAPRDVCLVSPVRNEIALIGEFLDHYETIGVADFIIVDNGSTDGTLELLLSDERCTVYRTSENFAAARSGLNWIQAVFAKHAMGRWGLFADCDEHLIYPDMDRLDVNEFAWRIHEDGYDSVRGIMLDMYHDGDVRAPPQWGPNESVYDVFSFFDADYRFRRTPVKPWRKSGRGPFQIFGGPRLRILSDLETEYHRGWLSCSLNSQIDRFINLVPSPVLRPLFRAWPVCMPALHKRPLNYVHPDLWFPTNHDTRNKKIAPVMTALIHFKFCNELKRCFESDAIPEQHYRRGLEREQLRLALMAYPHETLVYEGTRTYRTYRDVEEAGLIGEFGEILS